MLDVRLVSATKDPLQTLYAIWEASKSDRAYDEILWDAYDPAKQDEVRELFLKLMQAKVPVVENIDFVFMLENVPISFREQMVRHRIGVHVGDQLGVDIVPDLADSTWWSQSMRILDMGSFATNHAYYVPESIEKDPFAREAFHSLMLRIESLYNELVANGVPMEEAREAVPLAATHRISWKLNLASLLHIIGKRACWILQSGYWHPIIGGMIRELGQKVDPIFSDLANPPCIKGDAFHECVQKLDNERRVDGRDKVSVCPLYAHHHLEKPERIVEHNVATQDELDKWEAFWGRDPKTGVRRTTSLPVVNG